MIRQQYPYLEESETYLQAVYDLAKSMTPVEQVPILMDLDPEESMALQMELQEPRSPYRRRYLRGLAKPLMSCVPTILHSPMSVRLVLISQSCLSYLRLLPTSVSYELTD